MNHSVKTLWLLAEIAFKEKFVLKFIFIIWADWLKITAVLIFLLHYDLLSAFLNLSYPSYSNKLVYMLYLFKEELCRDVRVWAPFEQMHSHVGTISHNKDLLDEEWL